MRKKIIAGVVFVLFLGILAVNVIKNEKTNIDEEKVPVEKVKSDYLQINFNSVGKLESGDSDEKYISDVVLVAGVLVEEGDFVEKGKQLFQFDFGDYEFEIESEERNQRILEKQISLAKVEKQTEINNLKEQLEKADLNCKLALNQHDFTWVNLHTVKDNYEKGLVDNLAVREAERLDNDAYVTYLSSLETYENTKKALELAQSSENKSIQVIEESINASIEKQNMLKAKVEEIKQLQFSSAQGVVFDISLQEGQSTNINQLLYTIYSAKDLTIKLSVQETYYNLLQTGDELELSYKGSLFTAQVQEKESKNSNRSEDVTLDDTFYVIVAIDNNEKIPFQLNNSYEYQVKYKSSDKRVLCQFEYLKKDENQQYYVYCFDIETETIEKRFIQLGNFQGTAVELTEGLNEGDYIVADQKEEYEENRRYLYEVKE